MARFSRPLRSWPSRRRNRLKIFWSCFIVFSRTCLRFSQAPDEQRPSQSRSSPGSGEALARKRIGSGSSRATEGLDTLEGRLRRNIGRQLGLDALLTSLGGALRPSAQEIPNFFTRPLQIVATEPSLSQSYLAIGQWNVLKEQSSVNRKLFRPALTDMKEHIQPATPRASGGSAGGARKKETCSARADARGELLLCEADAVAHARRRGADGRGSAARHSGVVRPRLHQADAFRKPEPPDLQAVH